MSQSSDGVSGNKSKNAIRTPLIIFAVMAQLLRNEMLLNKLQMKLCCSQSPSEGAECAIFLLSFHASERGLVIVDGLVAL